MSGQPVTRSRVAAELRAARAAGGVSQVALAEALGRAQSYVSRRLSGDAELTVEEFVQACGVLGVDPVLTLRRATESAPEA
jgi:transcriptional regulator with XRE-family HTH domain